MSKDAIFAAVDVQTEDATSEPSTSSARLCQVCDKSLSKYTCPRCETKTCSLDCTKTHKTQASCSGVREKTEFVPMNSYNDVAMWRDLAFLREVGDKVKDWGGALNLPTQEAINRKERQLGGNRKGKQREDSNGRSVVVHDRLKNLSKKELALRKTLLQNGIEMLFLPREMERHKANRTSYNLQKKKLVMTVSIHTVDTNKKRTLSKVVHDNLLDTQLLDIVKKACPGMDTAKCVVVLPVPVRPVIFSKNAPFPERQPEKLPSLPPMQIPKIKPLPKAHASLPMKPSWIEETAPMPAGQEPIAEVEPAPPKRELPKAGPREVWLVDLNDTLKDALKGTSILEWPEFEILPEEVAREEMEAERLEYVERRRTFDRDDWKRKREGDDGQVEDDPQQKRTILQDDGDSGSSTSDSDSSSSLDSTDSDTESELEEDVDGEAIPASEVPAIPAAVPAMLPASQPLRGLASLPAKPPPPL